MKRCTKCGRLQALNEFYRLSRGGWRSDCRSCSTKASRQRAVAVRAGAPTGRYECDDCGRRHQRTETYRIQPPTGRPVRMCSTCWDALVGAAAMAAVR